MMFKKFAILSYDLTHICTYTYTNAYMYVIPMVGGGWTQSYQSVQCVQITT